MKLIPGRMSADEIRRRAQAAEQAAAAAEATGDHDAADRHRQRAISELDNAIKRARKDEQALLWFERGRQWAARTRLARLRGDSRQSDYASRAEKDFRAAAAAAPFHPLLGDPGQRESSPTPTGKASGTSLPTGDVLADELREFRREMMLDRLGQQVAEQADRAHADAMRQQREQGRLWARSFGLMGRRDCRRCDDCRCSD